MSEASQSCDYLLELLTDSNMPRDLPERLQIARRKRTTKLVVPNLHCVNVADVNSHNVLLPGLRRAVVEPVYAPGMGDFHLTA
jgi:hypothetical protein